MTKKSKPVLMLEFVDHDAMERFVANYCSRSTSEHIRYLGAFQSDALDPEQKFPSRRYVLRDKRDMV